MRVDPAVGKLSWQRYGGWGYVGGVPCSGNSEVASTAAGWWVRVRGGR